MTTAFFVHCRSSSQVTRRSCVALATHDTMVAAAQSCVDLCTATCPQAPVQGLFAVVLVAAFAI
jgi:hypothetical protein